MVIKNMMQKYTFPVGCVYNLKTEGGFQVNGNAEVEVVKKQDQKEEVEYANWAMKRVSNS